MSILNDTKMSSNKPLEGWSGEIIFSLQEFIFDILWNLKYRFQYDTISQNVNKTIRVI